MTLTELLMAISSVQALSGSYAAAGRAGGTVSCYLVAMSIGAILTITSIYLQWRLFGLIGKLFEARTFGVRYENSKRLRTVVDTGYFLTFLAWSVGSVMLSEFASRFLIRVLT